MLPFDPQIASEPPPVRRSRPLLPLTAQAIQEAVAASVHDICSGAGGKVSLRCSTVRAPLAAGREPVGLWGGQEQEQDKSQEPWFPHLGGWAWHQPQAC